MNYVFPPAPLLSLPIVDSQDAFPVSRVYCVGQNYSSHIVEMGGDARNPPSFFSKPASALLVNGGQISYPTMTSNLQHEVELVVALKEGGSNISPNKVASKIFGFAVGIDLTRRDLQTQAKARGHSWEMAKAFDQSAPISSLMPIENCGMMQKGAIWLKVNDTLKQSGDLAQMLWDTSEIIASLSTFITLLPGDLIFTGTPAGVSTLARGDFIECGIDQIGSLKVQIV